MPIKPAVGFILACIFLDALGIGLIVPVLPRLIGTLSETRDAQTWWYGLIIHSRDAGFCVRSDFVFTGFRYR